MKNTLLLLVLIFSINSISAHSITDKQPVKKSEHISTDRFFFISYSYKGTHGAVKIGSYVLACCKGVPGKSELILRAADASGSDHHCVQITGIDAICQSDFISLLTHN
jgi:hypothetical protein